MTFKKSSLTYSMLGMIGGLIIFFAILMKGLEKNPHELPSALIEQSLPQLTLPDLFELETSIPLESLKGQVSIFHVWATWCSICCQEHFHWLDYAKTTQAPIFSLLYRDDPTSAKELLIEQGNPYQKVLLDTSGHAAIEWGIYGTPETFIVDHKGIIKKRISGEVTPERWQNEVLPFIKELQAAHV